MWNGIRMQSFVLKPFLLPITFFEKRRCFEGEVMLDDLLYPRIVDNERVEDDNVQGKLLANPKYPRDRESKKRQRQKQLLQNVHRTVKI